jgi:hypothetical protein
MADNEGHIRQRWIDGGNDLQGQECFCSIGKDHTDPNPVIMGSDGKDYFD